jgi:hypothetical protein
MKTAVRLIAVTLLCSLSVFGQTENASISGRVTDPSGSAVVNAAVQVTNVDTGMTLSVKTNGVGFYIAPGLNPGKYRVTVSKEGFQTVNLTGIQLNVQDYVSKNIELKVGSVSEQVTVVSDAMNINTKDATVSTVVDQTYVKNMPINGRSFQDLILLTPGTVTVTSQENPNNGDYAPGRSGEFSVNGQRTEENYYTVDGVSANAGASGGYIRAGAAPQETALGTTQSLASVDELQEFRVSSSTYSAEYGRNPGAQIAVQTKSGTNSYHGTASDYLRNDYFDAADYFTDYFKALNPNSNPPIRKNAVRQNDFGGTFGGPLMIPHVFNGRDKTFFFVSYEGLRLVQPQPAHTIPVPDTALVAATPAPLDQIMKAFPVQNGAELLQPCVSSSDPQCDPSTNLEPSGAANFIGTWSNPSSLNTTSIRVDHMIKEKTRLFFRFSNSTGYSTIRGISSASDNTTTNNTIRSYTGGATSIFTSRLTNEFRLNLTTNLARTDDFLDNFGGAVPVNLGQLAGFGPNGSFNPLFCFNGCTYFLSLFTQHDTQTHQKQWNLVDTVGLSAGRHEFKFGADYRRFSPFVPPAIGGDIEYDSPSQITSNDADFAGSGQTIKVYPLITNYSFFVDDSWKVARRLSLSLGLRWEINPPPGVTRGQPPLTLRGTTLSNYYLAPPGTPLYETTYGNLAPRLGFAYTVRDAAGWETVLRMGGGLYYDTGQQASTVNFLNGLPGTGSSTFVLGPGFGGPSPVPFPTGIPAVPPVISDPTLANGGLPVFFLAGLYQHLQLPYSVHWNASLEQALGGAQTITLSFVGSHNGRLLQETNIHAPADSNGNSINPIIFAGGIYQFTVNGQTSDYDSLQAQFQRRLTHGLTALASYTWSHCLDAGSFNFFIGWTRGDCDEDVRHNFSGAFSYDLPTAGSSGVLRALLGHWGIDDRLMARTGFPVGLAGAGTFNPFTGQNLGQGINYIPGEPKYVYGSNCAAIYSQDFGSTAGCPGGWAINPNAFVTVPGSLGDVRRGFVRALGAWQMNLAVRREFPIYENLKLQFRAEAFNIFNHPNFGWVDGGCGAPPGSGPPRCTSVTFGQPTLTLASSIGGLASLYQMGGSRSMQFALKVIF